MGLEEEMKERIKEEEMVFRRHHIIFMTVNITGSNTEKMEKSSEHLYVVTLRTGDMETFLVSYPDEDSGTIDKLNNSTFL